MQSGNEFLDRTLFALTRSIFADTVIKKSPKEKKRMALDSHRRVTGRARRTGRGRLGA
jgi:hypothetical protein